MIKFTALVIILMVLAAEITAKNGRSEDGKNTEKSKTTKKRGGTGISAWAWIYIILLVIFIGTAAYYIIKCYPILCKEERNYDRMEFGAI